MPLPLLTDESPDFSLVLGGLCREATMLRDTLVGLIEPMWCGAGVHGSRAGFPRAAADIGR